MRRDQITPSSQTQHGGDERSRRGNEASTITGKRPAARRESRYQRGDLQPTDSDEHIERVVPIGLIHAQRLFDDLDLVLPGRVVNAGAAAGDVRNRRTRKGRHNGRRGGGITDAHLAQADHVDTARGFSLDHVKPDGIACNA